MENNVVSPYFSHYILKCNDELQYYIKYGKYMPKESF